MNTKNRWFRGVRRRLEGVAKRRLGRNWKERAKGADGFFNEVAGLGRREGVEVMKEMMEEVKCEQIKIKVEEEG